VRRITNFSSGELGVQLCNALARADFEVFCFKGSAATHPGPREQSHLNVFDTNDDLLDVTAASRPVKAFVPVRIRLVTPISMGRS
jgi:hypothetical protein